MPNPWITHVKQFALDNDLSYGCALSTPACRESYRKPVNYRPQLNRIAKMIGKMGGPRITDAKLAQARANWNELKNLVYAMPVDSDFRDGYIITLRTLRTRIQQLMAMT